MDAGVAMVHQELAFCKDLSVAENLSMGHYPRKLGVMVDKAEMARRADELLSKIGVSLDVSRPMHELSTAQEQLVQIAAAVGIGPRIVVFDEPTSSLAEPDAQNLFKLIESLQEARHDHDLRLAPDAGVVSAVRQDQRAARWAVCGHAGDGRRRPRMRWSR